MEKMLAVKAKEKEENLGDRGKNESQMPGFSGNLFQSKVLMWYLLKGLSSKSFPFQLGTEIPEAGKYDDLVLNYKKKDVEGNERDHFLIMQCKHRTGKNKVIKYDDVLTNGNVDFGLVKYFNSFVETKSSKMFKDGEIEHAIIYTNAHFDMKWRIPKRNQNWERLESFENIVEEIDVRKDSVLSLCKIDGGKYYKFKSELVLPVLKPMILDYLNNCKKKSKTSEDFENHAQTTKNQPLDVADADVEDFFEKSVFAIEQPDERKLEAVISTEIRKRFPEYDTDLIYGLFEKEIVNWMNTGNFCIKKSERMSKSKFISSEDAAEFFENTIQKFDKMVLKGPILDYDNYIRKYNIDFVDFELDKVIQTFSSSPSKRILSIFSEHIMITSIKLYIKLTKIIGQEEIIYVKLSSLNNILLDLAIGAFENKSNNHWLVIEWDFNETIIDKWTHKKDHIIDTIQCFDEKKLIIVSNRYDILEKYFPDIEYEETREITNTLMNIKKESHVHFLNSMVKFQGYGATLGDFIINENLKKAIDGSVLNKILKSEDVEIGKEIKGLKKDLQSYYVDRTFICKAENDKNIYMVSGITEKDLCFEFHDFKMIEKNDCSTINETRAFTSAVNENKLSYLLRKEREEFLLLEKSRDPFEKTDFLNTINYKRDKCEINLISAVPGMGKSTLLSKLSRDIKEQNPKLWVVKFDLNAMSSKLNKMNEKDMSFETVVNFLHHGANHQDELEKRIFESRLQNKNIVLCMDGFDEICPNYKSIVLKIIKILLNEAKINKIWLSTRPYTSILNDMKSSFTNSCLKHYDIDPFTVNDQKDYILKLWRQSIEVDKVYFEKFIEELFRLLSDNIKDYEYNFLGVALHAKLIGVTFMDTFKKYQNSNTPEITTQKRNELLDMLSLSSLYHKFVLHKCEILCNDKSSSNIETIAGRNLVDQSYVECVNKNKLLALDTLFNENDLSIFLTKTELKQLIEHKKQLNRNGDGMGIVSQIANNKPQFVHQTFAEYFVAMFFVDNLKKDDGEALEVVKYFLENMINEENGVICGFIDSILYDEILEYDNKYGEIVTIMNGEKLYYVLQKKWRNIAEILIENGIDLKWETEEIIRSASEVKNLRGKKPILSLIFEKTKFDNNALENILHGRWFDENGNCHEYILRSPLYIAIQMDIIENVITILDICNKMEILESMRMCDRDENILHHATKHGGNDILIHLWEVLKNQPEKLKKFLLMRDYLYNTPLDYTVLCGNLEKFKTMLNLLDELNILNEYVLGNENENGENILHRLTKYDAFLIHFFDALKSRSEILKILILKRDRWNKTPFDHTVMTGNLEQFKTMLNLFKELNISRDDFLWNEYTSGENILHLLTKCNNCNDFLIHLSDMLKSQPEKLKILLLKKDRYNNTPIVNTVVDKNFENFKVILNLFEELNILNEEVFRDNYDNNGGNILQLVTRHGGNDILIYLSDVLKRRPEILKILLLKRDGFYNTPLDTVVERRNFEEFKTMLNLFEEFNNFIDHFLWNGNGNGENILHHGTKVKSGNNILIHMCEVFKSQPENLKSLLLKRNKWNTTPIDSAVLYGNFEQFKTMLNLLEELNISRDDILWNGNGNGENILHFLTREHSSKDILIHLSDMLKSQPEKLKKLLLEKNNENNTPFDNAFNCMNFEHLKIIFNLFDELKITNEDILRRENEKGDNILHLVVKYGGNDVLIHFSDVLKNRPEILKILLIKKDNENDTLLDNTVMRGNFEIFNTMLNLFEELNINIYDIILNKNKNGENILHHATKKYENDNDILFYLSDILKRQPEILKILLLMRDSCYNTPLDNTVKRGNFVKFKVMLNLLEELNIFKEYVLCNEYQNGDNILHLLTKYNTCNDISIHLSDVLKSKPEILKILLLKRDNMNNTILDNTIIWGNFVEFKTMLNLLEELNILKEYLFWNVNKNGENILHLLTKNYIRYDILINLSGVLKSRPEILKILLLKRDNENNTPFDNAFICKNIVHLKIILNLLDELKIINEDILRRENENGENILHILTNLDSRNDTLISVSDMLKNRPEMLKILLLKRDNKNNTPLCNTTKWVAFRTNSKQFIKVLNLFKELNILNEDVLWNENKDGETILHLVITCCDYDILIQLFDVLKSQPEKLKKLLRERNIWNETPFDKIFRMENLEQFKTTLSLFEELNIIWNVNENGENILHLLTKFNRCNNILIHSYKVLKSQPKKLKNILLMKNKWNETPLDNIVMMGNIEQFKTTLNLFEELNINTYNIIWNENENGKNILHHATINYKYDILFYLSDILKNKPETLKVLLLKKDSENTTPIDNVIILGNFEQFKTMLNFLEELNIPRDDFLWNENKNGENILHHATKKYENDILFYLSDVLKNKPEKLKILLLKKDSENNTPLDNIVKRRNFEQIKTMLNLLEDLNILNEEVLGKEYENGENILHILTRELINHHKYNIRNDILIYFSDVLKSRPEILKILLLKRDNENNTPLDIIIKGRNLEQFKTILNLYTETNIIWNENENGENILHLLTKFDRCDDILIHSYKVLKIRPEKLKNILLKRNRWNDTPFDNIVRRGKFEQFKTILYLFDELNISKEDVLWNKYKSFGKIIQFAAERGDNDILIHLYKVLKSQPEKLKISLLERDYYRNNTILDSTVIRGNFEQFKTTLNLIEELNIFQEYVFSNVLRRNSENILHYATKHGRNDILIYLFDVLKSRPEILKVLLMMKDTDNNTAFDNTVKYQNFETFKIILNLLNELSISKK